MDDLNDLKALWLSADTTALPTPDEIVRMGKKFRNQKIWRKVIMICAAIFLLCVMSWVTFVYDSKLITTRIGEVLLLLTCVMLATTNLRSIRRFYDLDNYNNVDFIHFLERTKQNQIYFYKKTQIVTMSLASTGLVLYLFEMVYGHPFKALVVYTVTACYLAFLWLFVRPRVFKKHQKKLDEMITKLEKISKQF